MRAPRTHLRRGAMALVAAATMVAGAVVVPAAPAHAQPDCLEVTFTTSSWPTGPDTGGFVTHITITNTCPYPIEDGWTLGLTLAPGHTAHQGWSAVWTFVNDQLTAANLPWNAILPPGGSITIGFTGTYSGTLHPPVSCAINGFGCFGGGNEPPEVTLSSPAEGFEDFLGCAITFAAEATDPDGAVDRVEFYVDDQLVGTDNEPPYELEARPPNGPEGDYAAFARAYDDGSPALSTDSAAVTFHLLPPPPSAHGVDPCRRGVPPIPPEVTLTSPADGEGIPSVCPVPLSALATDLDGAVERVEFYVNETLVGTDHTAPYGLDVAATDPVLTGTSNTAHARAFDNDTPEQVGFTQQVTFDQLPIPPALLIVACTPQLEVSAGGEAVAVFASGCAAPTQVDVTVAGEPGVTVAPTSYLMTQDGFGDRVAVSAAPGTAAGATATVTARSTDGSCLPASVTVTVTG